MSLRLDRESILFGEIRNARVELVIHGWEMTSEVDAKGFFVGAKRHLVRFSFDDIRDVKLDGFNHQNAVQELRFSELPRDAAGNRIFDLCIWSAFGLGGGFSFSKGTVLSVTPCDQDGKPLSSG